MSTSFRPQSLRLGGVPEHFNYPWWAALEAKAFEPLNLVLHWSDVAEGTGKMAERLKEGSLDAALMLTEGALAAIAGGLDARVLGLYVESPLRWGIHVYADSPYQSVADLKGTTLAISREGSGSHLMSYLLAEREGWPTAELAFRVVGQIDDLVREVSGGNSSAFLWERTMTQPLVDAGKLRCLGEIPTPWPCFVLVAPSGVVEKHGTLLRKALRVALKEAGRFHKDPKAPSILMDQFNLTETDARAWLESVRWPQEPPVDPDMIRGVGEALVRVGRLEAAPDPADILA